ncbi:iron ABC transporter permease [Marinitoga sp. 1138]|uniref:ABC transporter permease n=1 Tax=Marinitoga sp. 1138 TaxID=1643334 RepID=UPI001585D578|nr:ABC transporter permease subunit [Marinitoga sp. 1138]NUU97040.1 ABC transporter permease [Marinitoga sp. 1138]
MRKIHLYIIIFAILWVFPVSILMINYFDFHTFLNVFFRARTLRILKNTVYQASLSTVFSFIISILPAIYVANNKNTLSKILENSFFIPFFFPPISTIISFSILYGNNGIINKIFGLNILYTLTAIIIAHSFYNSPIFVKYISDALRNIPKNYIENAIIDGASKKDIIRFIKVPLIIPSVLKGGFLVFMYSFVSFAIVLSLGGIKYSTFEVAIFTTLRSSLNFSKALSYALIQFLILIILNFIISLPKIHEIPSEELYVSKTSMITFFISIFYVLFEYSIVFVGIFSGFYDFINNRFTIKGLYNLFSKSLNKYYPVIKSIYNTTLIALIVGIISIFLSYIILRNIKNHKDMRFANIFIISSLGVSSTFIAMSLLILNIEFSIPYAILLIIGYLVISIPLGYTFLQQRVLSFDNSIIEAAKIDGANKFQTFLFIEMPILKNSLISSFLQIFAIVFGEFTISYTMQVSNYFPIVSNINYTLSNARYYLESQAMSSITVIIIFLIFYISTSLLKEEV